MRPCTRPALLRLAAALWSTMLAALLAPVLSPIFPTSLVAIAAPPATDHSIPAKLYLPIAVNNAPLTGAAAPVTPSMATATEPAPPPAPTVPVEPYAPPAPLVHLPALNVRTGSRTDNCISYIQVQNLDAAPAQAVLLTWRDSDKSCAGACSGPLHAECSGLMRPGGSWAFTAATIPEKAESGVVLSVAPVWAARLCDVLQKHVVDSCDGYRDFRQAYDGGTDYEGILMTAARGGPLAAEVVRDCPGNMTGNAATASYAGVPESQVGAPNSAGDRYQYLVPLIFADKGDMDTAIYMQNTGLTCASAEVYLKSQDDCLRALPCWRQAVAIAPGETARLDASTCVGPDWQGSAWVLSDRPLAIAVDLAGQDMLMSYNAVPRMGQNGPSAPQIMGSTMLFGPLTFSEYQGWDTAVQVQNMSNTMNAKAKVFFLNSSGEVITTLADWICPLGSQTFFLPVIDDQPGTWVGSVRVESQPWWTPGSPPVEPPRLSGLVTLIRYNDAARTVAHEAAAYNLLGQSDSFSWEDGSGAGGTESGAGMIAVPLLNRDTEGESGMQTEIGVANLVTKPGVTDFSVIVFDQNGVLDDTCMQLGEKEVAYLDGLTWSYISPFFHGSALISATAWQHPLISPSSGKVVRNLLGLGAVAVQRSRAILGEDIAGDEMSATTGMALRGAVAEELARAIGGVVCPEPEAADAARAVIADPQLANRQIMVPMIHQGHGGYAFDSEIAVQNLGPKPSRAALVGWSSTGVYWDDDRDYWAEDLSLCDAECDGPLDTVCSGLIKPGASWIFPTEAITTAAFSAMVFSLDAGASADNPAADKLCAAIAGTKDDCAAFGRFQAAYRNGSSYAGFDMAAARGGPLAVTVRNHYPAPSEPDAGTLPSSYSAYEGLSADALGAPRPSAGRWSYVLPYLRLDDVYDSAIFLQNAGLRCAQARVCMRPAGACEGPGVCQTVFLPPGETAVADALDFRATDDGPAPASAWIESSTPLAIMAEVNNWRDLQANLDYTAYPQWVRAKPGQPAVVGGSRVAFGPATFSEYEGWTNEVHVANLDPMLRAKVKVVFYNKIGGALATLVDWICPGGVQAFRLPLQTNRTGNDAGFVRAESLSFPEYDPDPPPVRIPPARISAVLSMVKSADPGNVDGSIEQGAAYNLIAASDGWADQSTSGVIAVPGIYAPNEGAIGPKEHVTELAVLNLLETPGDTDVALMLFDQNGLVGHGCERIADRSVAYLDMDQWGYITPRFQGSALISATYSTHEVTEPDGQTRYPIGLAAVAVQRTGAVTHRVTPGGQTPPPVEVDGDEVSATMGMPVDAVTAAALLPAAIGGQAIRCRRP